MPDGSDRPQRVCDVPRHHLATEGFRAIMWPQIAPFLEAALKVDELQRYTVQDVLQEILTGTVRLWVSFDPDKRKFEMAAISQIVRYPLVSVCHIWLGGGRNMKAWRDEFMAMIEAYARAEGCRHLTGCGRLAWTRAAPGWKAGSYMLLKELA